MMPETKSDNQLNIPKILLFAGIIVVLMLIFSSMMHPVKWVYDKTYQNRDSRYILITEQPEKTIEVLNIGDSLSLSVFNPMELWREFGYTGFNIGADGLRMAESFYSLKNACRNQEPKVLLIESLYLFRYSLKDDAIMLVSQPIYYRIPFLKYHNIWKSLVERPNVMIYHRGYTVNENEWPYLGTDDYMDYPLEDKNQNLSISSFNRVWFDRIKDFCDENGIRIIIYSAISPMNYNWERVHNLERFAQEEGVDYIDLNEHNDEIGIDWARDTNDAGDHLNYFGSVKVTRFLGNYIKENYPLTDHRGDPAYSDWDEEIIEFDQLVKDMEGLSFQDIFNEREQEIWNKKYKKDKK